MSDQLKAFLSQIAALKNEAKRLHQELAQYTKGLAVAKGITAALQLLEQLEEKEQA